MTTVSVVECLSPVSLRTCGSSGTFLLQNRKRLQTKCVSPTKRCSPYRQASHDFGLESTLMSSPIPSPIPRSTLSLCGNRVTKTTIAKSPSSMFVNFREAENDQFSSRNQPSDARDLFVVGSKPRLHGMWEISDSRPASPLQPLRREESHVQADELFDPLNDDRASNGSPENPPPSPINFVPSLEGFVVGGHKLVCPERTDIDHIHHNRDFTPGFVKQPQHHCIKCQGRIMEAELSQVTFNKRLSSIRSSHTSRHHVADYTKSECVQPYNMYQFEPTPSQLEKQDSSHHFGSFSFSDICAEKKRLKTEKQRLMTERRQIRKEEQRVNARTKLLEKIKRKEETSTRVMKENGTNKRQTLSKDSQNNNQEYVNNDLSSYHGGTDHLPPINSKRPAQRSASSARKDALKSAQRSFADIIIPTENVEYIGARLSRSDIGRKQEIKSESDSVKRVATDTEINKSKPFNSSKRLDLELPTAIKASFLDRRKEANTVVMAFDEQTPPDTEQNGVTSDATPWTPTTEKYTNLQKIEDRMSDDTDDEDEASAPEITMTSTMIVPERDTRCTQWISFNGDNEPVLNTSPEVDDGCDTFLKRLQRSKLINQNDQALPSGQQFCFEAMVDKRYNRWKRRRRKKHSQARRESVIQCSESSDEEDVRNKEMERIIDKMYEEIHGPVPHSPSGTRDTPRSRNRRRRKEGKDVPEVPEKNDDVEEQPSATSLYEASSEWTSDGALPSCSSTEQISNIQVEAVTFKPEAETSRPGTPADDICSWPYLEQYKSEILKRLKSTPPDEIEDLDKNDWLPNIQPKDSGNHGDGIQKNEDHDISSPINGKFYIGSPDDDQPDECRESTPNFNLENIEHEDVTVGNKSENIQIETADDRKDDYGNVDETDTDNTISEYEPYIRVDKPLRASPLSASTVNPELSFANALSRRTSDATKQIYSYSKWSRSQKPIVRKQISTEQKPLLISRTSAQNWSEMGCSQDSLDIDIVSNRESRESTVFSPLIRQENIRPSKDKFTKKNNKVALSIKKQNVNLPSLTKNSRSQTLPDTDVKGSNEKPDKPGKVKQKSMKTCEERAKTQSPRVATPSSRGSFGETRAVPEFLFKDYYMRSLYGNKTRINSHVDSKKNDKALRKTLTVDNLEILAKRPKKKAEVSKPNELAFTRSFTFSMFDLPEMYKLYNTTLERRANGEEIEVHE